MASDTETGTIYWPSDSENEDPGPVPDPKSVAAIFYSNPEDRSLANSTANLQPWSTYSHSDLTINGRKVHKMKIAACSSVLADLITLPTKDGDDKITIDVSDEVLESILIFMYLTSRYSCGPTLTLLKQPFKFDLMDAAMFYNVKSEWKGRSMITCLLEPYTYRTATFCMGNLVKAPELLKMMMYLHRKMLQHPDELSFGNAYNEIMKSATQEETDYSQNTLLNLMMDMCNAYSENKSDKKDKESKKRKQT